MTFSKKMKYVRTDGWRGYYQPVYAVAGANDTGTWSDSPCNSNVCKKELKTAQWALKQAHYPSRIVMGRTSNVFCVHKYLIVPVQMIGQAREFLKAWYEKYGKDTRLLYLCD